MKKSKIFKILSILLCALLLLQQTGFAQVAAVELNIAGHFASAQNTFSPDKFRPLHLRSISYDGLNNNFKLLLDKGDTKNLEGQEIELTTKDLLNYFFVGIALPNDAFWVNLRPDSPGDIIDPLLAHTQVGKILLEADLQLKKDTANATNPGTPEGKEYWNKLYQKAGELYGNQNVTIPTLTRPWIVPDEIIIRESAGSAYIYKATLKVMLEQDYLKGDVNYSFKDPREKQLNAYSSQIIREDIIPKLNKEINNAKRYAPLRQVYYSLVLAQWFKARNQNKDTQYSRLINKKDLTNLEAQIPYSVGTYFNAYKENFAKGEYNIKEPAYTPYGQVIRSYFSGGIIINPNIPVLGEGTVVDPKTGTRVTLSPASTGVSDIIKKGKFLMLAAEGSAGSVIKDSRDDLARRRAIDRIIADVEDYSAFEQSIEGIMVKLENKQLLSGQEIIVLNDLKNRLILKNSLVAMELKVNQGDVIVTSNQPGIKFLNSAISEFGTNRLINLRKEVLVRLLIEEKLIRSRSMDNLSLLFKQDKFVIRAEVIKRLGGIEKLSAKLNLIAQKLSVQLTDYLHEEYKDLGDIQKFVFVSQFGVSAPVRESNDNARILADIQALQAAKMARHFDKQGLIFNQDEFDRLMRQADKLRQDLGLAPGKLPPEKEMKEVRSKSEDELLIEIKNDVKKAQRQFLIKQYLDIIDLFDYQKTWRANPIERKKEMNRILDILKKLENIIQNRAPPDAVANLQEALAVIKANSKNQEITSGEAFLANSIKLSEKEDGRLIAVDVIGFWASIQKDLAWAHRKYMEKIGAGELVKEKAMLITALIADDLIKRKMAGKLKALIRILGDSVLNVELSGVKLLLVNQEGGDEIVFYIKDQKDWDVLAKELSNQNLGVRIMASRVSHNKDVKQLSRRLGLSYTEITHGDFGEAYITAQEADKKVKALEEAKVVSAVISNDDDEQGKLQWFVYYQGKKMLYDDFYQELVKEGKVPSANSEDYALEGNVTKADVEAIAELADLTGTRHIALPVDIVSELEQKFGPGRVGSVEVVIVPEVFMQTKDSRAINGPVRLGNKVFVGDNYFAQYNSDLRSIIAQLGHEAMAQWTAEIHPELSADEAHELAIQMEEIFRVEQRLPSGQAEAVISGDDIAIDLPYLKKVAEETISKSGDDFKEKAFLLFGTKKGERYEIKRIIPVLRYLKQTSVSIEVDPAHIAELIDKYATGDIKLLGLLHTHPYDVTKITQRPGPSWEDRLGEDIILPERSEKIIDIPLGIVLEATIPKDISLGDLESVIPDINAYFYLPEGETGTKTAKVVNFKEWIGQGEDTDSTKGGIDFRNLGSGGMNRFINGEQFVVNSIIPLNDETEVWVLMDGDLLQVKDNKIISRDRGEISKRIEEIQNTIITNKASVQAIKKLFVLENKLNDSEQDVRHAAFQALGQIYAALINQGRMSLSSLETKLNDSEWRVREATAQTLGQIYAALINQGKAINLSILENKLNDSEQDVRHAAFQALGPVYAALINQGRMSLSSLETQLNDSEWRVREAAFQTLVPVYAALINQGKAINLSILENKLNDSDRHVREATAQTLGQIYAALINQGKAINLSILENKLNDSEQDVRHAAFQALGPVYAALINQGKAINLSILETQLNDSDWNVREAAAQALGQIYTALINQGKAINLSILETKLNDSDRHVREAAAQALGQIYTALINQGRMSLSSLENKLNDSERYMRQAAAQALGPVYTALINQGMIDDKNYQKYEIWKNENLPYEESIITEYLDSSADPKSFISSLKQKVQAVIRDGFDYNNPEQVWLAFMGARLNGLNMNFEEFKERLSELAKFDKEHLGYFNNLFSKTKGLGVIEVGAKESRSLDVSQVNTDILNKHLSGILAIRGRIDSLSWITEDFPQNKVFTLRNLFFQLKKQQAISSGQISQADRFNLPGLNEISEDTMRQEILRDKKLFYKIAFGLAKDRLGDPLVAAACLNLMRDLIISDTLFGGELVDQLRSDKTEDKINAFKSLYEDYKNHLPDSLGIKIGNIKGLSNVLENYTAELYKELAKVTVLKTKNADIYQLIPEGFLSVFRGRAGIIDCSFDMDKGTPFTRAMHEDTLYYFVYKGKELKGYVGLLVGQTADNKKILTIDTINSPSLDGEELLTNLFKELANLAAKLGCSGIALPRDIGPSFNFDNENTIMKMEIYNEARLIKVAPVYAQSWKNFTGLFGQDQYNSIEDGSFRKLNIAIPEVKQQKDFRNLGSGGMNRFINGEQFVVNSIIPLNDETEVWVLMDGDLLQVKDNKIISKDKQEISKRIEEGVENAKGGIDFRFLPIVTQSMDNLKASVKLMPTSSLQRINLTQEWSDIERLVNAGITPSTERLKEYFAASNFKGNLDSDMTKIVSCISDILRMEEQSCNLTDPTLKDMLVVLGSGRSGQELKSAFAN